MRPPGRRASYACAGSSRAATGLPESGRLHEATAPGHDDLRGARTLTQ
ncbi:hypothetical protein [Streptomyces sp. SA15]|nr:hypothetical protein [Streptomyces sp. SA15]